MTVVEISRDSKWYPAMLDLRLEILRTPLGLDFSERELTAESNQRHFVLVDSSDAVVGCGLAIENSDGTAKIRQVAIVETARGKGHGQRLMAAIEVAVAEAGATVVKLHARESVVPFYEKIGYQTAGALFIEVGVPHQLMRKPLLPAHG